MDVIYRINTQNVMYGFGFKYILLCIFFAYKSVSRKTVVKKKIYFYFPFLLLDVLQNYYFDTNISWVISSKFIDATPVVPQKKKTSASALFTPNTFHVYMCRKHTSVDLTSSACKEILDITWDKRSGIFVCLLVVDRGFSTNQRTEYDFSMPLNVQCAV